MADIDVGIEWNFSEVFSGICASLGSAKDRAWNGIKNASDEAAASLFGVGMILIASILIWRRVK